MSWPAAGEADVVVVGGALAGAIIAARLAEDRNTRVILLEAGPSDEGNRLVLELRRAEELLGTDLDYDYAIDMQLIGNSRIRHSCGEYSAVAALTTLGSHSCGAGP